MCSLPVLLAASLGGLWLAPSVAQAGIPECGGMRLEDAFSCEIRGDISCTAGCDDLGVYKKACATKLHTVCRDTCVLDPEPSCTDECTDACGQQCDAGINVICQHNCFDECAGSCTASCENANDETTCRASCEATCDGECDIQCAPVVSGSCYQHCIECCGGSCGAQANMTCQTSCQEEEFETCEYEFRADCMASCSGDGALFCDGEYVLSGNELDTCINAIIELGIDAIDVDVDLDADIDAALDQAGFCSVGGGRDAGGLALGLLVVFGLAGVARRRRAA